MDVLCSMLSKIPSHRMERLELEVRESVGDMSFLPVDEDKLKSELGIREVKLRYYRYASKEDIEEDVDEDGEEYVEEYIVGFM
ncbi:hypothetical protein HDV00_012514 [Rhizophlyctis rosea]|nr:hypothetical protein HDV00_012514 [Rhizophlyctis rosea]